jgi:hypothetical protein
MIRRDYLDVAASVIALLAEPAVEQSWTAASALPEFRVCGLAGHLAGQVSVVAAVLDADPPGTRPISLLDHYARSTWTDGDIGSDLNTGIRLAGEQTAAIGLPALREQTADTLAALHRRLPDAPADLVVQLPFGPWALTLDDFLATRMLEIAVHSDDLAVSVGVDTPAMPPRAEGTVLGLLCRWSAARHGGTAVLRALSRAERAVTVTAI